MPDYYRGERTPYRIVVFAQGELVSRSKRKARQTSYGYMGWTADQTAEPSRLPGSGTFLYHGLHKVEQAARAYLALPETQQVSIRTNQDRQVYRYFKAQDGTISGYGGTI